MKNMMCHEIAIAVTHCGLRASNIQSVTVHKEGTAHERRGLCTDFSKLDLTVDAGDLQVTFQGDRCGGDWSEVRAGGQGNQVGEGK